MGAALKALQGAVAALPGVKSSVALAALLSLTTPKDPPSAVSQKASLSPVAKQPGEGLHISKCTRWLQCPVNMAVRPLQMLACASHLSSQSVFCNTFHVQDDAATKPDTVVHLMGVLACLEQLWKQCSPSEAAAFGQDIASAFSRGISSGMCAYSKTNMLD